MPLYNHDAALSNELSGACSYLANVISGSENKGVTKFAPALYA